MANEWRGSCPESPNTNVKHGAVVAPTSRCVVLGRFSEQSDGAEKAGMAAAGPGGEGRWTQSMVPTGSGVGKPGRAPQWELNLGDNRRHLGR